MKNDLTAAERMSICRKCPHLTMPFNRCEKCGCFMDLKSKLLGAMCLIGKW